MEKEQSRRSRNCQGPTPCAAHTCKVCGRDDGTHWTQPHLFPGELILIKPEDPEEEPRYIFKIGRCH